MAVIEMNPNFPSVLTPGLDDSFSGYTGTAYQMGMESTDKTVKPKYMIGSGVSGATGGPFDGVDPGSVLIDTTTGMLFVRTLTGWKAHT